MHLDRVLCIYLSNARTSIPTKSGMFFKVFSKKSTPSQEQAPPPAISPQSKLSASHGSRRSSAVVPLETSVRRNFGEAGDDTFSEDELQWHTAAIDDTLCDLMMYESVKISSNALQLLVMMYEQASQFVEELGNSQLLADRDSAKMFQDMTTDANILSFALESFEVWSSNEDKAGATSRRVLHAVQRLNQIFSDDVTLVLRRGLRRLGVVETIVHEVRVECDGDDLLLNRPSVLWCRSRRSP